MRVFVIRHAEPEPFQGPDPPLTPLGRQQAERLARALQGQRLDPIVCSTMRRAVETATPLSEAMGAALVREPGLVEADLGALWAFGAAEQEEWTRVCDRWRAGDFAARPRGGESLAEVIGRVGPVVRRVVAEGCERGVAIIGHAVVNGVILPLLCPELRPRLGDYLGHSFTGIWELEGEGRDFRVLRWNDSTHLSPGGGANRSGAVGHGGGGE